MKRSMTRSFEIDYGSHFCEDDGPAISPEIRIGLLRNGGHANSDFDPTSYGVAVDPLLEYEVQQQQQRQAKTQKDHLNLPHPSIEDLPTLEELETIPAFDGRKRPRV